MSADDKDRTSLIERATSRLQQSSAQRPVRGSGPAHGGRDVSSDAQQGKSVVNIDVARLREQGYLTPDGERTRVAEEFRIIKRPLLENAFGRASALVEHGNLIMVTSAIPGEGKTYTAVNLALSIAAEMDKTVLLIDADAGRARVHELLKLPQSPGLIDLLDDDSLDVSDVMVRTSIPKLRVIPMGRFHSHSNELLASEAMKRITQDLATRYHDRVVIFDSPPILSTSEAVVLAGLVGQIVFVVESNRTPQGDVKDALSLLDGAKPIGMVLNKVRTAAGSSYYGYGSSGSGYYKTGT
jgi:protein-tyrosine kinase